VIFREGEASDAAYLLVSGAVDIVTGFGSPERKTIAVLGKGQSMSPSAMAVAERGLLSIAPISPKHSRCSSGRGSHRAAEGPVRAAARRADRRIA
jgi:CRP-like cAMP-binding protein